MKKDDPFFIAENIDSGKKSSLRWVEDSYGSVFRSNEDSQSDFLSLSLPSKKIRIFLIIIILGVSLLAVKSFYLQIIKGDYYFLLAENNRIRTKYIKAQRGIVYDRNENILVKNIFGFSLLITPADLPKSRNEREATLNRAAEISNVSINEIEEKISKANKYYWQPVVIKTGIDYERAMALKIASADFLGISIENDYWRQYVYQHSFSHILGYIGKINAEEYEQHKNDYLLSDNIGKTGLEKEYENHLRGQHGKKGVEVDSLGRIKKVISQEVSISGNDLILTIDADLQEKIYEILQTRLDNRKAASVIVSNPQNGEILALVDYPSYENNLFSVGISQEDYSSLLADERKPLFDRSIAGEYPSGSTIKPVIASAALQEGIVTRRTSFNSLGGLWVAEKWFFPDWKSGGHGISNVIKAISESVNTYFYYIGGGFGDFEGLGIDRIAEYMDMFNLGKILNIDLPGEKSGLIPTPEWKQENKGEGWYIGDTYHLAIGQGDLLVTPLQVNSFTATIANGGTIYRPYLVKEIIYADGRKELIMSETLNNNFINAENINIVRQAMRETVISGSARSLSDLSVAVAGKTGTAQWNKSKSNHAWFTAFAPFNQPTFAITVLVEEGGEGSAIASPIAKEVISWWFSK